MPGAAGRGDEGVRYGYDAMRLPLRFAESCNCSDVDLAARLMIALDRFPGDPAVRDLGGAPLTNEESVVSALGKAAALAAVGDPSERATSWRTLSVLNRSERRTTERPGMRWGDSSLTTDSLGGCPPI